MKKLYLLRHAKSSWKQPELSDLDRPLNKRGLLDAPLIGDLLNRKEVNPSYIISSPSLRTLTTIQLIADKINFPKQKVEITNDLYEASVLEIMNLIKGIHNDYSDVMIVGHNPGLTNLVNYLTDDYIENIPTCGIVCLQFNLEDWSDIDEETGKIIFFEYPKKHKKSK